MFTATKQSTHSAAWVRWLAAALLAQVSLAANAACPGGMTGAGDTDSPCLIETWAHLQSITSDDLNGDGNQDADGIQRAFVYRLENDLLADDAPENFTPLNNFGGTILGNNKTISGLKISQSTGSGLSLLGLFRSGFFSATVNPQGVIITDLTVKDAEIVFTGDNNAALGAIFAQAPATLTLDNVHVVNGTLQASGSLTEVGGLVGFGGGSLTIKNSSSSATVVSAGAEGNFSKAGGLVGRASKGFTVTDSHVTGDVTGTQTAGGLIGEAQVDGDEILRSYATGNVSAGWEAGGLIGRVAGSGTGVLTISDSYSTSNVERLTEVKQGPGSFTPWNGFGGLIGFQRSSDTTLSRVFASGDVTVADTIIDVTGGGGLIGLSNRATTLIEEAYATGAVSMPVTDTRFMYVGGLLGYFEGSGTVDIRGSYAVGPITGPTGNNAGAGGIAGRIAGPTVTFTGVYWDQEATGEEGAVNGAAQTGATALTTAEMIGAAAETNMTEFDFPSDWKSVTTGDPAGAREDKYPILSAAALNNETSLAAQLAAVIPRKASSDPEAVAALVGFDGDDEAPGADVYEAAGVSGVEESNLDAYASALAAVDIEEGDVQAIQDLVSTYNDILNAASSGQAPDLVVADYAKIGVEVSPGAVGLLNNGVAAADSADVDTVAEVQAIANAANTIAAFAAGTSEAAAPTAATYESVGFEVEDDNVPSYNSAVAERASAAVEVIDAVITAYDKLLAGTALTEAEFTAIGVTFSPSPSATELALINDAVKQANTVVGTVTEVQAIVTAAQRLLAVAGGATVTPALTLADFQAIGVIGVTATNLSEVVGELAKATASDLDTVAKLAAALGDLSDPVKVAELVAFDGTGEPPAAAVYEAAGVGGVDEDNLSAYASALAAVDIEDGDIQAIQAVVDTYNDILAAAESGNAPSLDSTDYAKIGVEVSPAAVALLNNGVAAADSSDVDTVAEVQAIANAADRLATLASAGTGTPTAADYSAVGITAVVATNATAYNSAVKQTKAATAADIQKVVTAYNTILAAAGSAGASGLTAANYADIGVEGVTATTLGLLNSAVGSQSESASNTVAKLQAMASAAAKVINTAANSQDAGLTVADFVALGIQGVNDGNLAAAIAVIEEASAGDVQTIAALQALLSAVLTPPLPVPTLSFWALLLMALLLMAMALRQPAMRRLMH